MTKKFHKKCFACGKESEFGLQLKFELQEDKSVCSQFKASHNYQGYDDILHGGIISTILDSAMVNLFYLKNGLELKTAKLNLRFIRPIPATKEISICAVEESGIRHFYKAKAKIMIDNVIFAKAEGYFK